MNNIAIKKRKNKKSKISFDEEVVTKDRAIQFTESENTELLTNEENDQPPIKKKKVQAKQKNKKKPVKPKLKAPQDDEPEQKLEEEKNEACDEEEDNQETQQLLENNSKVVQGEKKESKRSIKRKKVAKLMEEKKTKTESYLQNKAIEYLSKWKHCKSEWKFEKLRQVWLQQNLFDSDKIPDAFWNIVVDYFDGAKGHSRKQVLDTAIKYIEEEENLTEENMNEKYQNRLKRARDIVQMLQ